MTPPHISDQDVVVLCKMRPPKWPWMGGKARAVRFQPKEPPELFVCVLWRSGSPRLSIHPDGAEFSAGSRRRAIHTGVLINSFLAAWD